MQINGAQLATAFSPKSLVLQDNARKPVTIDIKASLEVNDEPNRSDPTSAKIVQSNQAPIMVNEQQQARFVRFFSVNDFSASSPRQNTVAQKSNNILPQGVQAYLKVEATNLESRIRLLDETV